MGVSVSYCKDEDTSIGDLAQKAKVRGILESSQLQRLLEANHRCSLDVSI